MADKPYWKKVLSLRKELGKDLKEPIGAHELEGLQKEVAAHTRVEMLDDRRQYMRAEALRELGMTEEELAEQQQQRRPKEPPKPPDNSRDKQGNDLIMVRPEQQEEFKKWGGM